MSKVSDAAKQEAAVHLREMLKPGDEVLCVLVHVSRSGMQREIKLYGPGEHAWLVGYASTLLGMRRGKRDGLVIGGCGMDMGFALVYELSHALFKDGFGCIGEKCPSNDHNNGDRDYTPHSCIAHSTHSTDGAVQVQGSNPPRFCHWHKSGGYALRHRWL